MWLTLTALMRVVSKLMKARNRQSPTMCTRQLLNCSWHCTQQLPLDSLAISLTRSLSGLCKSACMGKP